ncbi:MAG: Hsp70 family protein [Lachnospiraceae bacterium]
MNVGIDLGSTYSTFSVYDKEQKIVKALIVGQGGSQFVPSIAGIDFDGNFCTGLAAKDLVGDSDCRVFKAFKMLLPEKNPDILRERKFTEEYSPRKIAKRFLEEHLKIILHDFGEEKFDQVIICAPEVWNEKAGTLDGRIILRDICHEIEFIEHVRVISEPEAASAYFAHSFEVQKHSPFEGNVLIIDYGGGTLDITITNVNSCELNKVQVTARYNEGAGENQKKKIGDAGIAYMEGVVTLALQQAGVIRETEVPSSTDGEFMKAVDRLELMLQSKSKAVEERFDEYDGDWDSVKQDNEQFIAVKYNKRAVPITYAQLYIAYEQIIYPVLNAQLDKAIAYMDSENQRMKKEQASVLYPYMDSTQDRFKIALVGGFGKYTLVQRQVKEKFHFAKLDKRLENIGLENRESAVSLGAALVASDVISIQQTAKYSIGVFWGQRKKELQKAKFAYGVMAHQEINFSDAHDEHIYKIINQKTKKPHIFSNAQGRLDAFAIEFSGNRNQAGYLPFKREMSYLMEKLPFDFCHYGFSFDDSGVVTFHVMLLENLNGEVYKDHLKIELGNYGDMFDTSTVDEEVYELEV